MAVTTASVKALGTERAVAILTTYCDAIAATEQDSTTLMVFQFLDEILADINAAETDEEKAFARDMLTHTVLSIASITAALINDCAARWGVDKFDVLSGLAKALYGGIE